jgi:hypothetical protein
MESHLLGRFEPAYDITCSIPGYASCCVRKELRIAVGKYGMRAISEKQKEKKHSIFVAADCTLHPAQTVAFLQ